MKQTGSTQDSERFEYNKALHPGGLLFGTLARGANTGTGSFRLLIREQRAEGVVICDEELVSPEYVLRGIRRISGLTWEELACVMGVSRRSLHLWDGGGNLTQEHLHRLHELSALMQRLDKGNPVHLRNLLLKVFDGKNALERLRTRQDTQVLALLGHDKFPPYPKSMDLPAAAFRKRIPDGVSLDSYSEDQSVVVSPEKPIKGIRPPRLLRKP